MNQDKPPSLYGEIRTCIICDRCGLLKHPRNACVSCGYFEGDPIQEERIFDAARSESMVEQVVHHANGQEDDHEG